MSSSSSTRRRRKVTTNKRGKGIVATAADLRDAVTVAVARKRQEDRAWIRQRLFFPEAQRRIEEAIWAAARNGKTEVRLATFNNVGRLIQSVWSGLHSPVPFQTSIVQQVYARKCTADLETVFKVDSLRHIFTHMLLYEDVTVIDGVRYEWRYEERRIGAQQQVLKARWDRVS